MLVRNTVVNVSALIANVLLAFATTAILAKRLGPAAFGVLALVRSIAGNAGLLETLFGSGVTRYVAFFHARGELQARDGVAASGLVVNLVQGICLSGVLVVTAGVLFDRLFVGIPVSLRHEGLVMSYVFFGVFVLQICSTTLSRTIEGLQAYPAIRISETIIQALLIVFLVMFFSSSFSTVLHNIAWIYLAAESFRLFIYAAVLRYYGVSLTIRRAFDVKTFRKLFDYGRPLFVAKMFTMLGYRGDALVLAAFLSVRAVADYQIANQVWSAALAGLSALTAALLPAFAERHAKNVKQSAALYLRTSRYCLATALMGATFVVLIREVLIQRWVGPEYASASVLILLFMIQIVVAFHQGVSGIVALGAVTHGPMAKVEAVANTVNLILSILLVRRLGVTGVVIAGIVKSAAVVPAYVRMALQTLGLHWTTYWAQCVLPVWRLFAVVVLIATAAGMVAMMFGAQSLTAALLQIGCVGIATAPLLWRSILNADDRKRLVRAMAWS